MMNRITVCSYSRTQQNTTALIYNFIMLSKKMKIRVAILFGYNGRAFHGSQKAVNVPTVEGALERAIYEAGFISDLNFGNLNKIGWSRGSWTDKGVHAL